MAQRGRIELRGNCWLLRYRESVIRDGKHLTRQVAKKIATYGGPYRTEASVRHLAEEILSPINTRTAVPESTDTVAHFIENIYLPQCEAELRPSTLKAYRDFWKLVKPHVQDMQLREFRTPDAQRVLDAVASAKPRARTTMRNIKAFLSCAFRFAKIKGAIAFENPVRDARMPKAGLEPGDSYAYSLDEIQGMLAVLDEPFRTIILVFALTGLRVSEVKGLQWADFSNGELHVTRSVWRGRESAPKTRRSRGAVPVLPVVADALAEHRKRVTGDTWIFAGLTGKPLRLEDSVGRYIRPTLEKAGIQWHGWHAFRRGLATNLYSTAAPDKTIQAILRHADVSITMKYYVRPVPSESVAAMKKLELAFKKARKTA